MIEYAAMTAENELNQAPDKETSPAKMEWWDAHFSANKLFPQKMRVIRLYTYCEVVLSPPDNGDFLKLRNSRLTEEQIKDLEKIVAPSMP